jgi:ribosomal protein S9
LAVAADVLGQRARHALAHALAEADSLMRDLLLSEDLLTRADDWWTATVEAYRQRHGLSG